MEKKFQCKDIPDKRVMELAVLRSKMMDDNIHPRMSLVDMLALEFPVWKVCYTKLNRMNERGLLDCGTSCAYSFPTDKGMELLKSDDELENDEYFMHVWTGWVGNGWVSDVR